MSLTMLVEAWVLSVIGWAWISTRSLLGGRTVLEETCTYGMLLISSCSLVLGGLFAGGRGGLCQAHTGAVLALWALLAYGAADSLPQPDTGREFVPPDPTDACCPNARLAESNRALYFGGARLYLVSASVTLAFQTVQVLIAAGALAGEFGTVWPGHHCGAVLLALLAATEYLRFSGDYVPAPCPDGAFRALFGVTLFNYGHVFALLGGCLLFLVALESIEMQRTVQLVLRVGQLAVGSLLAASSAYAMHGRGMLTWSVVGALSAGWLPMLFGFFELCRPEDATAVTAECVRPRRRARFVMPISTKKTA